jgi:hypothetical protein
MCRRHNVLGTLKVDPRPVLYLALEDGEDRLQSMLHDAQVAQSRTATNYDNQRIVFLA